MATETAQREWFGLGRLGWALWAVTAIMYLYIVVETMDSVTDQAVYGIGLLVFGYGLLRVYKFVLGLVKSALR